MKCDGNKWQVEIKILAGRNTRKTCYRHNRPEYKGSSGNWWPFSIAKKLGAGEWARKGAATVRAGSQLQDKLFFSNPQWVQGDSKSARLKPVRALVQSGARSRPLHTRSRIRQGMYAPRSAEREFTTLHRGRYTYACVETTGNDHGYFQTGQLLGIHAQEDETRGGVRRSCL